MISFSRIVKIKINCPINGNIIKGWRTDVGEIKILTKISFLNQIKINVDYYPILNNQAKKRAIRVY